MQHFIIIAASPCIDEVDVEDYEIRYVKGCSEEGYLLMSFSAFF
jgi:hypothetical protein